MMRTIIITIIFILGTMAGYAQQKTTKAPPSYYDPQGYTNLNPEAPDCREVSKYQAIDKGTLRILYAFNATDITNPQTYDDLQRLEIGSQYSKYYSSYVYQQDSSVTYGVIQYNKMYKMNIPFETVHIKMMINGKFQGWSEYLFAELFKNFSTNELTEYCRMPLGCKRYDSRYTESIPIQEWQIEDETQQVAGMLCQKATCRFRGRNYTAWLAADIPISQGPWKFAGLPGLIMKVYDSKQQYVFECVGIENHAEAFSITLLDSYKTYTKTTREKLNKLPVNIQEDYYHLATHIPQGNYVPLNPHNPLELE